jgi:prepilin-type N-terminal cleavage/methylation domain-containing protein
MAAFRLLCSAMPRSPKCGRATRGYSIIEMLTAMALSTILLMVAVPRFVQLKGPYVLRQTTQQIAAEFQKTRMRAIARNQRYRFQYASTNQTYTIQREQAPGSWVTESTGQLPTGATITMPGTTPIFDTRGMLNQTAAIPVTVSGYSSTKTVTINVLGNVTIS